MPRKSTKAPAFKSEPEEADWYTTPDGRRQTAREFERALRTGTLARSSGLNLKRSDPELLKQLMEEARQKATRPISIRIPIADLEHAKRIAERKGLGYQAVLKKAIRDGLKRAG
jgi:hypothetical protein